MIPKTSPKSDKSSPICPPSKVPKIYPPIMRLLEHLSSQYITFSQWLIYSWAAGCTLPIGQRAHSGMICNVIVLALTSYFLISNSNLLGISKETKSTHLDDFQVSLLPDHPPWKIPFELLETCFCRREASWIWARHFSINIRFLPDMVDHILGWRWEEVIQGKVAVATTHRCLGARYAVGLLATINDVKQRLLVWFLCSLYPSSSRIVKEDCGNIRGVQTTISIRLLPAAPNLLDYLQVLQQTGDCSIHDWQNGHIDDWCNYLKYWFNIWRPVPWVWLSIVFTHHLPSNIGIHIRYGGANWLDKKMGWDVAIHLYRQRNVIQCFLHIVICIHTPSGRVKEALGWWYRYQCGQSSLS